MNRAIRVLELLPTLRVNGLSIVVGILARGLDPNRFEVEIACFDELGPLTAALERDGFRVHFFQRRPGKDLKLAWKIARLLRRGRFDCVHAHNATAFFYGTIGAILARTPRRIFTEHDRTFPSKPALAAAHRFLHRRVDRVVTVAAYLERALVEHEGFDPRRIEVIANGLHPGPFDDAPPRADTRRALGIAEDRVVLVCVARLDEVKNHAFLLEAFRDVAARLPKALLLLVGDGPLRTDLEARCRALGLCDAVRFLGIRDDVPALLRASDAVTLTSHSEGLSMSLIEALASRLPSIATAVGGNGEIVDDGVTGFLVAAGDGRTFADRATRLLSDAPLREKMGEAARRAFDARFSGAAMVARYTSLFERAADRGVTPV
ncbi:MAG: glycosyltransferase [Planctomycetes bacterium]|nr:glycosyltransferase [Planctomycetota bacterium]MBI3845877.1 glycosyltransferase [Planctomycetota bacterium]